MRLPVAPVPWYLRPLHAWQQRLHGSVPDPTALWTWRPGAMLAFLALFRQVRRRGAPVSLALRTLAAVRVSQLTGCEFCVDLNAAMLEKAGVAPGKALALPDWRTDPSFDEAERLVIEYAEAMTATPPRVDDALFARLRERHGPEAIVELTAGIALQNLSARFNTALGARAHGFCRMPGAPETKRPAG